MSVKRRILLGIFLVFFALFSKAQVAGNRIARDFISKDALNGSGIGLAVRDLSTGRIVMSEGSGLLLAPASTLKTVTTAAAMELLGPDYRFRTVFGYSGRLDTIVETVTGDLVVKGGGDPTLGSMVAGAKGSPDAIAQQLTEALKKSGIVTIAGDLVVDVSAYDPFQVPGSWAWEDIGNYYGAAPSALTFADNMIRLYFDSPAKSGEPVTLVRTFPEISWLSWQNELKSSFVNRDLAYVYGSPWGEKRLVRGSIPSGRKSFEVKASMPDPSLYLGHFLASRLAESGIRLKGSVKIVSENQEFTPVLTLYSPPLVQIIHEINHESVNLFAEHLVLQLALEKSGKGNMQEGLKLIEAFWKEKGAGEPVFLEDGSGLSRYNAISARFLVKVLTHMHDSKNGALFRLSLPSAGNGTLSGFSGTDFPGETLRCKSGSMERVRGYAGYLQCVSGSQLAFAVLVNNFPATSGDVMREIMELLKELRKNY